MTYPILILALVCAVIIIAEHRVYRMIIYFGIFSLIVSVGYLLLGAPDVAMAEAVTSAFSTIFFIVCVERYYNSERNTESVNKKTKWFGWAISLLLTAAGFVVYLLFIPQAEPAEFLKDLYLTRFMTDVGGENSITAIYLAYRVYDTLFEALILVISVVAVVHLSYFVGSTPDKGRRSEIERSGMTAFTMRLICPVIFIFAIYLIANGHISAGGGFQGGLAVATFFICRYLIHGIYDLPVKVIVRLEEVIFIAIVAVAIFVVVLGISAYIPDSILPVYRVIYLIMMNILIGLKVACGFFVLFYRFITIERR
ncbi:MAG: DUF4040 domain-containing protein [Oscillospiraceae bacterium]|nr:DUF4040 domain-containing protein [Oscillospiraceae bacterium]